MYKILIVDDEELERNALRAIINKGIDSIIEINEAVNGREAIVKSRSFYPDIIFLDIKMPGIDGIEAAKAIKKTHPSVLIIFLTAFNQFEYAHEAIQIGVEDFIIKPSSEIRVLEVITKLITKIDTRKLDLDIKENNKLKLNRATGYLENEFVYNLAVRGITEEKFENYLSILDFKFCRARSGIVKLVFNTYPIQVDSSYQKQVLKKRCIFIIRSFLKKRGIVTFFNIDFSNIFLLLSTDREKNNNIDDENISTLMQKLRDDIKKTINLEVVIGLGSVFSSFSKALLSFSEAKNNLATLSVNDGSSQSIKKNQGTQFPLNLEIEMEQAVSRGDRENVLETFQKISEWFIASPMSFQDKKNYILELTTIIKHTAAYQSPNGKCLIDYSEILEASGSTDLLDSLNLFLNNILEKIIKIHELENSPVIEQACVFINANYKKDISLEETALHCRLSSFYFSKLFKKTKKLTFIEYLTNQRITEAAKLLLDTNMSIKEISSEIGYNDPNYFTRVFKRVIKSSPTAYRSNKMLR